MDPGNALGLSLPFCGVARTPWFGYPGFVTGVHLNEKAQVLVSSMLYRIKTRGSPLWHARWPDKPEAELSIQTGDRKGGEPEGLGDPDHSGRHPRPLCPNCTVISAWGSRSDN